MARVQILELPMEHRGDDTVTPFAIVIDQASEEEIVGLQARVEATSAMLGARGFLLSTGTLEIA